jgi:hypothetical protein
MSLPAFGSIEGPRDLRIGLQGGVHEKDFVP